MTFKYEAKTTSDTKWLSERGLVNDKASDCKKKKKLRKSKCLLLLMMSLILSLIIIAQILYTTPMMQFLVLVKG